jgi:hypothetical protein
MAVAMIREDQPDDKRLVAYVVPTKGATLEVIKLRDYLREKLPEYMVPGAFVILESLPLTPNKKVDRIRLPAPDRTRQESEESYVAPRTPVEEKLAEIWARVLGLDQKFLFQNPTVADMVVLIVQNKAEQADSKDIDRMLAELEDLSDGEARRRCANDSVKGESEDE